MNPTLARILVLFLIYACMAPSLEAAAQGAGNARRSTTRDDRRSVALTIYNANLGLVKDQRQVKLARGTTELLFMDVASAIIPSSVSMKSLADPKSLAVLEQNYEYDLLNPQKLMDKYVGREVKLYQKNPYTDREETVTATLLSNNGGPIYRIGDQITFGHPGRVVFPEVPEDLIARPTLVWLLRNGLDKPQLLEASYLSDNINWRSDYVVTLNGKDDLADLTGWVTIDNRSGATYDNASLKLVAGDIHRVTEEPRYRDMMMKAARAEMAAAPQFKEEEFFEYHIYTLERPATIKDNQTKQITLVQAASIPVKKELVLKAEPFWFYGPNVEGEGKQKVGVFVEMENRKEHNLGMPLPKGIVRVYKEDGDGGMQFVGEDSMEHTPRDEKIRIRLGEAFDVVAARKQTDWKKIAEGIYEAAFEISLRNHKKEAVTVKVVEPVPGDWEMVTSSHQFKKSSAFFAEFDIPVPKDKEVKLTYRVRMKY